MFESVAPETFRKPNRRLFYETLPLSITIHALAIAGALGATAWEVVFPEHSPRLNAVYSLTSLPEPPPPPPPPAPPKAQPRPVVQPPIPDEKIVAPTVIPDSIPVVEKELPVLAPAPEAVEGGVAAGVEGGVGSGEVGGRLGGTVGGIVDGRVHIERDRKLPLIAVSQEYPIYPDEGRLRGYEDALVIRYVIGKDGKVHEVTVIDPPKYKMFAEATTKAIRGWRFRPLVEAGEKQEVVHELTVYFQLR
jgi:protein TonB